MTLIIAALLLTGFLMPSPATAEETEPHSQEIHIYQKDVAGNNAQETVKLLGTSLGSDSNYNTIIKTHITNTEGDDWEISYEGGYKPYIQFYDLNHNNVNDLFYQSETGNGDSHHYHLHTFENGQLTEMKLPEQQSIKAEFRDDFQIAVQIDYKQEPSLINVADKASAYIRKGIYKENGDVKSDASPIIAPIARFEPVQVSDSQGYGLKSRQQISGTDRSDKLGTIETLWYYENGEWIILDTDWKPSD
ncbi:hypothetical protein GCM10028778_04490 [Barrientosiimonas marina]|uniref:Uncharacterized protein n=1 Tax=Lentibacillus kimchii TaxID=1542911 RepID=A0ABW2USF1_9BACI